MNEETTEENKRQAIKTQEANVGEITTAAEVQTGFRGAEPTLLDKAEGLARRIEEANKKHEELILREEELKAKQILGGRAEAGKTPTKEKELTSIEYANLIRACKINPIKV